MSLCFICHEGNDQRGLMCAACDRSYSREGHRDGSIMGAMVWAAGRARRAEKRRGCAVVRETERRIAEWMRTTSRAQGVLISIHSSPDIARLADDLEGVKEER